jgi:hypothetical protein
MRLAPCAVVALWLLAGCSGSSAPASETAGDASTEGSATTAADAATAADAFPGPDAGEPPFVDPYGGASGCDGGVPSTVASCTITMPLRGGLAGVLQGGGRFNCGWGNNAPPDDTPFNFSTYAEGPPPWHATTVLFTPLASIEPGVLGKLPSVAVYITANGEDGGSAAWLTPFTCSLEISSNASITGASPSGLYAIAGTGTCPDPAAPYRDNPAGPTTIRDFSFTLEYQSSTGQ